MFHGSPLETNILHFCWRSAAACSLLQYQVLAMVCLCSDLAEQQVYKVGTEKTAAHKVNTDVEGQDDKDAG